KALQTPVRERLQAEADRAMYERRALAVERERTISENELASRIELATRREQLVVQEGANARREAQETAAAERRQIGSATRAQEIRVVGQAEVDQQTAMMAMYAEAGQETLLALALRDAAKALPQVGSLTITPDLLTGALAAFTGAHAQAASADEA
ncbi:MAG: SPFH domain-containing protein, partial [Cellulomonadaceae bacterium]